MKQSRVTLIDVAEWSNLGRAAHTAGLGKRDRPEARAFIRDLDANLNRLGAMIRDNTVEVGRSREFHIHDPKPRVIHAPCFEERVLHHAITNHVGPVLDRSLINDTFACRKGKGTIAAVQRCQQHVRRFPWFAKLDIRHYFGSIDHEILKAQLRRKFRDAGLLGLLDRIIDAHHSSPGCGLPIGALTSQCLANSYLGRLDRFLLEQRRVCGMLRYMDDFAFWGRSRLEVRQHVAAVKCFVADELALDVKLPGQINRSDHGITFCGYRVFAGTIRLAASRRRRFRVTQRKWERAWLEGRISSQELQRGYAAALAITAHADSRQWLCSLANDFPQWYDDV